jgi:hypothetical protein
VLLRTTPKGVSWQKLTIESSWKLGGNRIVGLMTAGFPRRKPCNGAVLPVAALFLAPGDSNHINPVVYVLYETSKALSFYMFLVFSGLRGALSEAWGALRCMYYSIRCLVANYKR